MKLKTKFNIALTLTFLLFAAIIYSIGSYRLQKNAEEKIAQRARMLLVTMESSRKFTNTIVKPALYEAIPDKFIMEGMSSSFGARALFEIIHETFPEYYFKHAAPDPRNPINKSDEFETMMIQKFQENINLHEWQGYHQKNDALEYVIMKPIRHEESCNKCHGEPENTLPQIIEKYGDKNAFHRKTGDVIAALTVSVPADYIIHEAKKYTYTFLGLVISFFLILGTITNLMMNSLIIKPVKYLSDIASRASMGEMELEIKLDRKDEIGELAQALDRLKLSVKKAMERLKK